MRGGGEQVVTLYLDVIHWRTANGWIPDEVDAADLHEKQDTVEHNLMQHEFMHHHGMSVANRGEIIQQAREDFAAVRGMLRDAELQESTRHMVQADGKMSILWRS